MTAVTYPTFHRERSRLRSIGGIALLAAATIALAHREPASVHRARPAERVAIAPQHDATADLYATAVTP